MKLTLIDKLWLVALSVLGLISLLFKQPRRGR